VRRIVGRCEEGMRWRNEARSKDSGAAVSVCQPNVCLAWPQRSALLVTLRSTRQQKTKQRERRRRLLGLDSFAHSSRAHRT
jgi:hypothetical protein